ncbi:MAG TPA: hypothetical protein ENJ35_02880 [Gammaproteobacteria bacterium]|nr:hypothetical protein [Gammaproteobacteria bacterium]
MAIKGKTSDLMKALADEFITYGGEIVDGWVTRIVADTKSCKGIQYQSGTAIGKWLTPRVIVATGGYAGLFAHGIQTPAYGTALGRFLVSGGGGVNLEFVFKHGYGRPDVGQLTPTEGLPGVEIYDEEKFHATWLEKELYYGRGTANHLQAFRFWRRNHRKQYFIDFSYRVLWENVAELRKSLSMENGLKAQTQRRARETIIGMSREGKGEIVNQLISDWMDAPDGITFERFEELKQYIVPTAGAEISRIRQISYFSMGGLYHHNFETNLHNVFVTGEAMHDFGSHRVGGLPWALYLVSGKHIAGRIISEIRNGQRPRLRDFDLAPVLSAFAPEALGEIREKLYLYQEDNFEPDNAMECIRWFRKRRRELVTGGRYLDDATAWYLVAEAILVASLNRQESRGCFFRSDYPSTDGAYNDRNSYAQYDPDSDEIRARLITRDELFGVNPVRKEAFNSAMR